MTSHHPDDVEPSLDASLEKLQTDYLDILMLHFPCAFARSVAQSHHECAFSHC